MTADVSSSYIRCPVDAKVVPASGLFTFHVEELAAGRTVPMDRWRADLDTICALWAMTPCQSSRDSVANMIRDIAGQVRDFRNAAVQP